MGGHVHHHLEWAKSLPLPSFPYILIFFLTCAPLPFEIIYPPLTNMLVQWRHHFIILSYLHIASWFQTNQTDHESDDRTLLLCVLPMKKIRHFSSKIWSVFVTLSWFSKTEITDGTGILVFVRVLWDVISTIYWQFCHCFFKNTLKSSYNVCPIKITWRKMILSVCLTPVSMAMWRLHYDI